MNNNQSDLQGQNFAVTVDAVTVDSAGCIHTTHQPSAEESQPHSGRIWTIVTGLAVFGAILISVWFYLLPRLSGEPVSPTANVEIRLASEHPVNGWQDRTLHSNRAVAISPDVLLTASGMRTFRGHYLPDGRPLLELNLTKDAASLLRDQGNEYQIALIVNGNLLAVVPCEITDSDQIQIRLDGVDRSDAEEAFARLTE